jgi:hypothetical protein
MKESTARVENWRVDVGRRQERQTKKRGSNYNI